MPLSRYLDLPVIGAQTWIAASPTFQTLVGASGNPTLAAASIFLYGAPGNFSATRAFVGPMGRRLNKETSDNAWHLGGGLYAELEIDQSSYFDKSTGNIDH